MKYFLTGATGFIGGRLAQQLRQAGHEVIAIVRNPDKAQSLAAVGVKLAKGDVTDKASMRGPMTGVDGVFHVAGWYKIGQRDSSEGQKINVDGTRHVLELMQELKIPKGVYTSTLAINSDTHGQLHAETFHFTGQHLSEYDRTKAEAHEVAKQFSAQGLPLVIVMPGVVYGPGDTSATRQNFFVNYLKRTLPIIPQGSAFCWAHVDDVAHAHWLAMEKGRPGEAYIICGPAHTLAEEMQLAQVITGVPVPVAVPPGLIKAMSALMGVVEKFALLSEAYTSEGLRVSAGVTYLGDNSKAKRELGYNPRPLKEGLKETLEYEMKELQKSK